MAAIIVSSPGTQTNKTFDKISKLDGTTLLVDDNISKPKLLPQLVSGTIPANYCNF